MCSPELTSVGLDSSKISGKSFLPKGDRFGNHNLPAKVEEFLELERASFVLFVVNNLELFSCHR